MAPFLYFIQTWRVWRSKRKFCSRNSTIWNQSRWVDEALIWPISWFRTRPISVLPCFHRQRGKERKVESHTLHALWEAPCHGGTILKHSFWVRVANAGAPLLLGELEEPASNLDKCGSEPGTFSTLGMGYDHFATGLERCMHWRRPLLFTRSSTASLF